MMWNSDVTGGTMERHVAWGLSLRTSALQALPKSFSPLLSCRHLRRAVQGQQQQRVECL